MVTCLFQITVKDIFEKQINLLESEIFNLKLEY